MLCGVGIGFACGGTVAELGGAAAVFMLAAGISVSMGVAARGMLRRAD
jgi:hypothetical protein